uniref:Uncharacterized protein n=1 Tax=Myotis myotis TaxID=51298 RepID=A0A7J7WHU4_MYOMY|nr:hypothetical protein mMyoMyo1_012142 [Myotis myotis]
MRACLPRGKLGQRQTIFWPGPRRERLPRSFRESRKNPLASCPPMVPRHRIWVSPGLRPRPCHQLLTRSPCLPRCQLSSLRTHRREGLCRPSTPSVHPILDRDSVWRERERGGEPVGPCDICQSCSSYVATTAGRPSRSGARRAALWDARRTKMLFPSSRLDWGVNDQRRGAGCLSCLQWP